MFDRKTFLLPTRTARQLYAENAAGQPICDYHCHLSPKEIYEDVPFENIGRIWLSGDHYKWRAMRLAGCEERLITGDADDLEKFRAFAAVCEKLCGSPVHHWAQLELDEYFDIDEPLTAKNADEIYRKAGEVIRDRQYSPRKMIERAHVTMLATTDDPTSGLEYHEKLMNTALRDGAFPCRVLPSFRPDPALKIAEPGFVDWITSLGASVGDPVVSYDDLLAALEARLLYFAELDTRISDQVIEYAGFVDHDRDTANLTLRKRLRGETLTQNEILGYAWRLLADLARMYAEHNFVMQIHIGAFRNVNSRMLARVGRDAGFDIMWDARIAEPLVRFLDRLDADGALPKTILYPLNGRDFEALAAAAASFPEQGIPGKVQLGAAWWHNDHKEGINAQLTAIAQQGLLPYFVGMLTDSRSFLSYTRHDYFRRILCAFVGDRLDAGEYIASKAAAGQLIEDICYGNAARYFE